MDLLQSIEPIMNIHIAICESDVLYCIIKLLSMTKGNRKVHFSDWSQVIYIDRPSVEELHERWYTVEDKEYFITESLKDINTMFSIFIAEEAGIVTDDVLCKCIGIENSLCDSHTSKCIQDSRVEYTHAVILEQRCQRLWKISNTEEIAKVARAHSKWFCERAHAIATGYVEILSD